MGSRQKITVRFFRAMLAASFLLAIHASPSAAQPRAASDPVRFIEYLRSDIVSIGPSLLDISPVTLTGASGLVAASSGFDTDFSERAVDLRDREIIRLMNELGEVKAMRPFTFLVFVGSLMQPDHRVQDAAFTSFESVILANLATGALKAVFGRARPFQEQGADVYKPFSGNTSFPSGHATTVFAAISPWAAYYPGPVTYGAMILAGGTALARVALRFHWPSDVLAGAMIGTGTGYWLSRRHQGRATGTGIRPVAGPRTLGIRVTL